MMTSTAPERVATSSIDAAMGGQSSGQRWYGGLAQLYRASASPTAAARANGLEASADTLVIPGCAGSDLDRVTIVTSCPLSTRASAVAVPTAPDPTMTCLAMELPPCCDHCSHY